MADMELLTVEEVAKIFHVRRGTVLKWIKTRRLDGVTTSGSKYNRFYVEREALSRFVKPFTPEPKKKKGVKR